MLVTKGACECECWACLRPREGGEATGDSAGRERHMTWSRCVQARQCLGVGGEAGLGWAGLDGCCWSELKNLDKVVVTVAQLDLSLVGTVPFGVSMNRTRLGLGFNQLEGY